MCSSETPNLKLPQYGHGDHPDFLTEINKAYMTLDIVITELRGTCSIIEQQLKTLTEAVLGEEKKDE